MGRNASRIDVLVVRNGTRLFSEMLADALKEKASVRLLARPLTLEAAVAFCREHRPDVVLIEATEAPPASLRALVRPIRAACDPAPVLLLIDAVVDDSFLVAGLEAGALGIVDAAAGIHDVIEAVHAAAEGKRPVDPQRVLIAVESAARQRDLDRKRLDMVRLLTDREREVLAELARGLRNIEIADQLGIRPRTVETHVHNILHKLQVPSRTAAVALTFELEDLLPPRVGGTT